MNTKKLLLIAALTISPKHRGGSLGHVVPGIVYAFPANGNVIVAQDDGVPFQCIRATACPEEP
jgi:hypothetical protein